MKTIRLPNSAATGPERTALRIVRVLPAADQRLREQLLGSRRVKEAEAGEAPQRRDRRRDATDTAPSPDPRPKSLDPAPPVRLPNSAATRLAALEARVAALEAVNTPPPSTAICPEDHAWAAVSRSVCAAWSCTPEVLHSTCREADLVLIRHTAIWLLHRVWGTPQRVLAKRFRVTIGLINWAVQRVEERRAHPDWTHYQKTLDQLIAEQRAADLKPRSSAALPPQTPDPRPEQP